MMRIPSSEEIVRRPVEKGTTDQTRSTSGWEPLGLGLRRLLIIKYAISCSALSLKGTLELIVTRFKNLPTWGGAKTPHRWLATTD